MLNELRAYCVDVQGSYMTQRDHKVAMDVQRKNKQHHQTKNRHKKMLLHGDVVEQSHQHGRHQVVACRSVLKIAQLGELRLQFNFPMLLLFCNHIYIYYVYYLFIDDKKALR